MTQEDLLDLNYSLAQYIKNRGQYLIGKFKDQLW